MKPSTVPILRTPLQSNLAHDSGKVSTLLQHGEGGPSEGTVEHAKVLGKDIHSSTATNLQSRSFSLKFDKFKENFCTII